MRAGKTSQTALLMAFWRALADRGVSAVPGFSDPHSESFLRGGWRVTWRLISRAGARMRPERRARLAARFGALIIRVAFIDARLLGAVRSGIRQVVLLGAGLDTRAWRLAPLGEARVFEVDHPDTQKDKRQQVAALPEPAVPVTWVSVDFERAELGAALAAAGHRADAPTVWVWEGVVTYLTDSALRDTLATIRARSRPGSLLILHYHEPSPTAADRSFRRVFFSLLGEPQIGQRTRDVIADELTRAGFVVEEDAGIEAQSEAVAAEAPDNAMARMSRICVARVDGGA